MERGLASVFKLADTFCKHLDAQAAFLDWAPSSPPNQKRIHMKFSHLAIRLSYRKALQR